MSLSDGGGGGGARLEIIKIRNVFSYHNLRQKTYVCGCIYINKKPFYLPT